MINANFSNIINMISYFLDMLINLVKWCEQADAKIIA